METPVVVKEAIDAYTPEHDMELAPPSENEKSIMFNWGVRVAERGESHALYWVCLADQQCRDHLKLIRLPSGKTSKATRHLRLAHSLQSERTSGDANKRSSETQSADILWNNDGVDGNKSSQDVLVDWMTEGTNYNRWGEADVSAKEALIQEITDALKFYNLRHRSPAQICDRIDGLEKMYRMAENYSSQIVRGNTDEDTLRQYVTQYFPYYYRLQDAMTRSPARPADTADTEESGPFIIVRAGDKRPLAVDSESQDAMDKRPRPDIDSERVNKLLEHYSGSLLSQAEERRITMAMREKELHLKEKELKLLEEKNNLTRVQADIDVAIKKVQLESAQREAIVQLVLARKKLADNGISDTQIGLLLPLPAHGRTARPDPYSLGGSRRCS